MVVNTFKLEAHNGVRLTSFLEAGLADNYMIFSFLIHTVT